MKTLLHIFNRFFKLFIILTGIILFSNLGFSQALITIGTGTSTNGTSSYPAPYGNYYFGAKHQFLIPASEIIAAGGGAGSINSLAFNVASVQGTALNGFKISIGTTSLSALSSNFVTGLTQVYITASYTEVAGWNTHTFSTPFNWDGTSNLVIETCFNNTNWTGNATVYNSNTSYISSLAYYTDGSGVCAVTSGSQLSVRPNIQLQINPPYAIDLEMLEWTSPVNGYTPNANMPISIKFKNNGTDSVSGFNLIYSVDGGQTLVTETYTATVLPGDTVNYTFTNTANMDTNGVYQCGAIVSHPNDSFGYNDTIMLQLSICNVMSGNYTIGIGGFPSIGVASYMLAQCGVSGPVTFNIVDGTYYENVYFGYIPGASAINTITFQSQSGDSSAVVINGGQNTVLGINNTSFIKLKKLTLSLDQYADKSVIQISPNCNNIDISNCVINGANVSHGSEYASAIQISQGTHNNISITNNIIKKGSFGIYIMGNPALNHDSNNVFSNNQLLDQYYCGIHSGVQNSEIISNNIITTSLSNYSFYGIECYNGINDTRITSNEIKVLNTGCDAAIMLNGHNTGGTYIGSAIISNNSVSINTNGSGNCFGIYDYFSANSSYYFNSINIYGNNNDSRGFNKVGASNTTIKNNIFNNLAGGYTIYGSIAASYLNVDYNNLYSTGTNIAYLNSYYTNFSNWQSGTSLSTNGINTNPYFLSNTNLYPTSITMNNNGTPISGITTDKDNITRHATTPDIGAYEYTPAANDLSVIQWAGNTDLCGLTATEQVKVKVINKGTSSQSNFNLAFNVDNGSYITETYTGTILSGDTLTYTFTNTADLSTPGMHNLIILTSLTGDQITSNDTLKFNLKKIGTIIPPFYEDFEDSTNFYFGRIKGSETKYGLTTEYNGDSWVALRLEGKSNTGWNYPTNVTDAFANNPEHTIKVISCDINTSGMTNLRLMFDYQYKSTYDIKNNWFRVMINGTSYATEAFSGDTVWQPQYTDDHGDIQTLEFDLSSYIGGNISISLEAVLRYDDQGSGYGWPDQVIIDNIRLWEPALHDVGVLNITSSGGDCGSVTDSIYAIVRNFGLSNETNIPVYCSIQADDGFHSYNVTYTDTMPSFGMDYVYLGTFNTTQNGYYDVIGYTYLSIDTVNKYNDTARFYGNNEHHKNIPYIESFDNQNTYWHTNGFFMQDGGYFGLTSRALAADVYSYQSVQPPLNGTPVPFAQYEAQSARPYGKVTAASYLVFDYRINGTINYDDSIIVSLSSDCGDNFYGVYTIKSNNYWNGSDFYSVAIPISNFVDEYVEIQFSIFTGGNSSFFFFTDDVGIINAIQPNIGNDTTICQGESITLDAGYNSYPDYKHRWIKNGVLLADTNSTLTVNTSGTYIALILDSLGFTGKDTINIVVNQSPVVGILYGLNQSYCANDLPSTLVSYPQGGVYSGNGVTGNYFDPAAANIGINDVIYTFTDAAGCSNSDTVQTTVNAQPSVTIGTSLASAYCDNAGIVSLIATPTGGTFAGPGVSGNTFDPSLAFGSVDIIYTYTDANSCMNSDTVSTLINQTPFVLITSNLNSDYCADQSPITITAYPGGGTFVGPGVTGSTFNPSTANVGINQIIYNYSNAAGCSNSDTITTTVNSLPTVTLNSFADICENQSPLTLSGGAPANGTFSGSGVNPVSGLFHPSVAGAGLNSITYTYTDINGCTNNDSENIRIVSTPSSSFSIPSTVCLNDTVSITYQGSVGATANFMWNFDNGVIVSGSGAGPYEISWDTIGIKQLSLSVTDSGCTSVTTNNYTNVLNNDANITAIGSTTVCFGDSVILFANTGFGYTYQWLLNSTILPNDTNSFIAAKTVGDYSVIVTNSYLCTDTSNIISVTINPLPIANFTVVSNACSNTNITVTYTGNASSSANYNWDFSNASIISGSGQGPYQIMWTTAGTKSISLVVSENNCTSVQYSQNVVINSVEALVTAIGNTTFCQGDSVPLSANTGANLTHQWYRNSTPISGAVNPYYIASTGGSYHVVVTNNVTGCAKSSTSKTVTVNTDNFNLAFTATPNSFTAPPFIVTFNNQTANTNNYYFYWDLGDGTSSTFVQPFHSYQYDGTYTVTLIAENIQTGCRDTLVKPNYISCTGGSPNPCSVVAEITPSGSAIICLNDSLQLTATSGSGWIYQWLYNGVIIPNASSSTIYAKQAGEYRVRVSDTVCTVTSNPFILGNHPSVIPVISSNDSIRPCTNDSMELYLNTFYNSYMWSTGQTTQSIFVKYSGNYTVTTTDINSCSLVSNAFVVNASLLQPPAICIVGVDSLNHNRIVWERTASTLIDSFYVYRESTVAGVYQKIGNLGYNQPSLFVDTNSNPAIRAYRYKLTASDTCGAETSMSDFHKTMHLTINKGLAGSYNLIWDGYQGFQFGSYAIYRGIDSTNLSLLTQIQSTLWSYTDLNPPSDTVFYQIEVINSFGCYADSIMSKVNTNYNSSRSNVASTMAIIPPDTTGIYVNTGGYLGVNIYPNPNNGKFTIETISESKENINIQVFNSIGKLVYSENDVEIIGRLSKELNLDEMPKGIYFVRLINAEINMVRKIVIQ